MKHDILKEETLDNPEINLTPLIDVVFVILIMFIVVVPLLEVDRVSLATTIVEEKNHAVRDGGITLHVYEDNSLILNGSLVPIEELAMHLDREKKRTEARLLTLFHDKNGSFGTYQRVKETAESVGFEELDVILKPN